MHQEEPASGAAAEETEGLDAGVCTKMALIEDSKACSDPPICSQVPLEQMLAGTSELLGQLDQGVGLWWCIHVS